MAHKRLGYIQRFFISTFMTIRGVMKRVNEINAKFNTTKEVHVMQRGPGRLTMRLFWNPNGVLSEDICSYNKGIYSAIPLMWGMKPATVEEPFCRFRGDPYCQFECSWKPGSRAASILESLYTRKSHLFEALAEIEKDKSLLKTKFQEISGLNVELRDKVDRLEGINKASRVLASCENVHEFLDATMRIVVDVLRFDRALLMLTDGKDLVYAHSTETDPALLERIRRYRVPVSRDSNVMVRVLKAGKPFMVEDVEKSGLNPDNLILSASRPFSFCLCPLVSADGRTLGVLGADRIRREPLRQTDLDTLSVFANNMAAFLRRAQLDEKLAEIGTASGRFVPRELLEHLGRGSIVDVRLGDQVQKEMSVLFSDIRSFTSLSETMTPKENFNFLNSYLSRVSPLIRKHNGFIDKYLGDGIMALFPGGAEDAIKSAIDIVRYLPVYNGHREKSGYKSIRIGNGIHSGSLMLGTIGEEARMEGTVIADAVNLASRLEGLTKIYGGSIVVSEQGLFGLSDPNAYNWRFLGKVRVKGKRNLVSVFEIFDGDELETIKLKAATREVFERAVSFFHSGEFRDAELLLAKVLETHPDDRAATLLAAHSARFAAAGAPPDWDGGLELGLS